MATGIPAAALKTVKTWGGHIKSTSMINTPVDTGSLRASHRLRVHALPAGHVYQVSVTVGGWVTNPKTGRKVDYAKLVHDGTSRTPARPFLRQAIETHKREGVRVMRELIRIERVV